jgi:GDPmannose 4,6-dehydratase
VHGLIRSSSAIPTNLSALPNVHFHHCDLTHRDDVKNAVFSWAPDAVFHLAGLSSVWRSWEDPVLAAEVNAISATCLLEASLKFQETSGRGVAFVNASSAEIFAGTQTWPQTETTTIAPTSPYGASKVFSHHLTQIYRARGLGASNAILYSHESPRRPDTFVTRKITKAVAEIAVTGIGTLILGDLAVRRDWGWAPDYVRAMTLMAEQPQPDDFIVATGTAHSVQEFVELAFEAAQVAGWERFLTTDPAFSRVGDAKVLVGDSTKAADLLAWAPTRTLRQIVAEMVEHDVERCTALSRI